MLFFFFRVVCSYRDEKEEFGLVCVNLFQFGATLLNVVCGVSLQDNVFVSVVCSIQYRVVRQNADDAFYELQNPREQIQSYVFDGLCFSSPHAWMG